MEALLKELFVYEPETGIIRSKVERGTRPAGVVVGRIRDKGEGKGRAYRMVEVGIGGKNHKLAHHRLAWLLHYGKWPSGVIDHLNMDTLDNRLDNLRDVTPSINSQNKRPRPMFGVQERRGLYRVRIAINGDRICLGTYKDRSIAERVFNAVKRELHDVGPLWDEKNLPNSTGTPA